MTRLFRPFPTLVFAVAAFVAMGRSAHAQLTPQQKQEIHQHYDRATRAYDLGKYTEAVDEYQKVYEIDGDPVMLYNIAQAYRLNDQPQDAIHFYRRYLQRSPEARNREDVERKIAAQEKVIEEKRKAAAAVQPPPIRRPTPKTTRAQAARADRRRAAARRHRRRRPSSGRRSPTGSPSRPRTRSGSSAGRWSASASPPTWWRSSRGSRPRATATS